MYCCKAENSGYILHLASEIKLDQALGEMPIVKEYPDVFPKDISKFSLEREIEFFID